MKKVLIITYYWPPAGGIGVLRCLKFAKYLRKFGWEPVIYAPENASYPYLDKTNEKDIPQGITILKTPISEPFGLFKKLSGRKKNDAANPVYARDKKVGLIDDLAIWIRGNFFIPDARSRWIKPSVKYLVKYLKENPVDAILTDGPPHTNTVIGCRVSQKTGIPWLADFQDPWTQVDYYKMFKISKWADKKHRKLEQEAFATAKKITIASPTWAKDLESIGAKNVDTVYYGYDEDDFINLDFTPDNDFSIVHAGLLGYDRKPDVLFEVLSELKKEIPGFSEKLKLKFAGNIDFSVKEVLKEKGLEENLVELGNITKPEALQLTVKAHILLLPLNKADNVMGRIPGKIYENLRAYRPILALGPKNSDVDKIITKVGAGKTIEYEDFKETRDFIVNKYNLFLEGKNFIEKGEVSYLSNENQTKKIAEYLNKISNHEV
ncbi:MAG: glycosyl transferase family 1 [Bacteroidales bacterium]|nr:glycosyl transferase family 1 [Bacteroidales bacterium]